MKVITNILFFVALVGIFPEPISLEAQDDTTVDVIVWLEYGHGSDEITVWRSGGAFLSFDAIYTTVRTDYQIIDAHIDPQMDYLYWIEVPVNDVITLLPVGDSRLVRVDLDTDEIEIVLTQRNMQDFHVSPEGGRILVEYYPPEIEQIDRDSIYLRQYCVVDLQDASGCTGFGDCDLQIDGYILQIHWLTDDTLMCRLTRQGSVHVRLISFADEGILSENLIAPTDEGTGLYVLNVTSSGFYALTVPPLFSPASHHIFLRRYNDTSIEQDLDLEITEFTTAALSESTQFLAIATSYFTLGDSVEIVIMDAQTTTPLNHIASSWDMDWQSIHWLNNRPVRPAIVLQAACPRNSASILVVIDPFSSQVISVLVPPQQGELFIAQDICCS